MTHRAPDRLTSLHFYSTAPYPCSYLADHMARSQVAVPSDGMDVHTYSQLVRSGFRRSGYFIYRPYCDDCVKCISVRVPVAEFEPSRTQRKLWRRHQPLQAQLHNLHFDEEHYQLYNRYQQARHDGGSMAEDDRQQYSDFILKSTMESWLAVFREPDQTLRMVSLIDRLDDGLSAVYTFFDPQPANASFGTYNVLWQIELCRRLRLPYLYLGYWVQECRKMAYKTNFQPLERLSQGRWQRLDGVF
ncbi:arginyltransferase [Aquaspirillum serpens]|uniref:arginyltransferase n=1 Tax=Aquaspirillum serpens TaxID=190 RepID=UPI0003B4BA98|nr:arginyltransferase [Aquaspirillum serpens]